MTTLKQAVAAAKEGDVIDWSGKPPITGDFKGARKKVTIKGATFGKVRIHACSGLTFDGFEAAHGGAMADHAAVLWVDDCHDLTMRRGTITGGQRLGYGLNITGGGNVAVERLSASAVKRGIVIGDTTDVILQNIHLSDLRSDGINIGRTSRLLIDGLTVEDIRIAGGEHPDVIQIINSPTTQGICSDITIRRVKAHVQSQGIVLFDHGRGGADRITIEDVELLVGYYHAINMENVRGLTLRNIRYGALPGIDPKIKPWVRTPGSTDVVMEDVAEWTPPPPPQISPLIELAEQAEAIGKRLRALADG